MYYKDIPPDLQKYVPKNLDDDHYRINNFILNKITLFRAFDWSNYDPTPYPIISGRFWCAIDEGNFEAARNMLKQVPKKTIQLKW